MQSILTGQMDLSFATQTLSLEQPLRKGRCFSQTVRQYCQSATRAKPIKKFTSDGQQQHRTNEEDASLNCKQSRVECNGLSKPNNSVNRIHKSSHTCRHIANGSVPSERTALLLILLITTRSRIIIAAAAAAAIIKKQIITESSSVDIVWTLKINREEVD